MNVRQHNYRHLLTDESVGGNYHDQQIFQINAVDDIAGGDVVINDEDW